MLVRDTPGCHDCPLREDGNKPFVPDELVEGAPALLYFQNPGADEVDQGKPLVGATGQMMEKNFFPLAGLARGEVSLGNAIRCRWYGRNSLPPLKDKQLQQGVAHCTNAHHRVPSGTKAILAAGEYATYALTGVLEGFSEWRGYVLPYSPGGSQLVAVYTPPPVAWHDTPVLVTNHLAYLFRVPSAQVAMKRDWSKLPQLLERAWPVRFPVVETDPPKVWPRVSAFDTEFWRDNPAKLERWSMATPDHRVWVVEARDSGSVPVAPGSIVIGHNIAVDTPHLAKVLSLDDVRLEDTMYADSVLWSTFPHDLNYLGSLYGRTNRHKHLAHINPIQYSAGDALHTMDVWAALVEQFTRDPESKWVYEHCQRPLLPIILKAKQTGSKVDRERARVAVEAMHTQQREITQRAQASVGWPINVGSSKQVGDWLYKVEGVR